MKNKSVRISEKSLYKHILLLGLKCTFFGTGKSLLAS